MPIPKPRGGETKEAFMSRFMADAAMQAEYPDEKQRYAIGVKQWADGGGKFAGFDDWIPIFQGGPQTDSLGRTHDGDALIDRAIATFNPAREEPPAVVGHPADNAPAFGWVENIKKEGGLLWAKFKQVQPAFADMVKQGLYKKRSAAFYPDGRLRHVGFLGAMPPAVKGLPDVAFAGGDAIVIEFATSDMEAQQAKTKEEDMNKFEEFLQKLIDMLPGRDAGKGGGGGDKTFSEADIAAAKKTAAEEAKRQAAAEFAEEQNKNAALVKRKAQEEEIALFCDTLVKEGKLPPSWVESGLKTFARSLSAEDVIQFSEKGEKKSQIAFFKEFMAGFGKSDIFKEIATKERAGDGAAFAEAGEDAKAAARISAKVNPKK